MQRRSFLMALLGVASLSQLPPVLAAPTYPRGQTPSYSAMDELPYQFGKEDFTVEYWMRNDPSKEIRGRWDHVALIQGCQVLRGYVNGSIRSEGFGALDDYRFEGAAMLAEMVKSGQPNDEVNRFMRHMQRHMPDGYLANLRVTLGVRHPGEAMRNLMVMNDLHAMPVTMELPTGRG